MADDGKRRVFRVTIEPESDEPPRTRDSKFMAFVLIIAIIGAIGKACGLG
ncbi:hypothetical protein [Streptomyces sp. NPDC001450]